MRTKIVAGNWKMNNNLEEAESLVKNILSLLSENELNENKIVILCPAGIYLDRMSQKLAHKKNVFLAAQNCHQEKSGAFTGEVSASMIKSIGCRYVILGHSERRAYFAETNYILSEKVNAVLTEKLTPIYCCGEVLDDRKANRHFDVVQRQIEEGLFHLYADEIRNVVVAYEPVWAIGTGETATKEQAQEMHAFIRKLIAKKYGQAIAEKISVLYGGSCKPSNAEELFSCADVDGGLIGGASLIAEDFISIIKAL